MQQRVGALIISDRRLLLVGSEATDFYWSPGGRIETGESDEQALRRELNEELGVQVSSFKEYLLTVHKDANVDARYYLVEIDGEPKASSEVSKIFWLSRDDYEQADIKISPRLTEIIIPKLIKENHL